MPKSKYTLITMPPKKWNWRSRISAVYMSENIPKYHEYKVLFCSSVLPLSELIGLRPDLARLHKVVYFHENYLALSMNSAKDFKYELAYNEYMTCLAADQVMFNSYFNKRSFIKLADKHLRKHSDFELFTNFKTTIDEKSIVIHFPLNLMMIDLYVRFTHKIQQPVLKIVWPFRWEFDRPPQMFYRVIKRLEEVGYLFKVAMFPQSFMGRPTSSDELTKQFSSTRLLCLEDLEESHPTYYNILKRGDVIVSTARTDFFCSQILEGMYCDLIPVLPHLPIYRELFYDHIEALYNTEEELYDILADLCRKKQAGVLHVKSIYKQLCYEYDPFLWYQHLMRNIKCKF